MKICINLIIILFLLSFPEFARKFSEDYTAMDATPMDLSRRCDSVETRKTPSPYHSSGFGESSPSLINESPSSLTRSSSNFGANMSHNRSVTPTNHYQSREYLQRTFSSNSDESSQFQFKRERLPTPPESMHHRLMHEQLMNNGVNQPIDPYILQVVQQKLLSIPATISKGDQSDIPPIPMILGPDGKLARPFKAYQSCPLNITPAIQSDDPLKEQLDHVSSERFGIYRQRMLERIRVANGGQATISNPKMRRTAASFRPRKQEQEQEQQQPQEQKAIDSIPQVSSQTDEMNSTSKKNDIARNDAYFERRRKNNAAAKKSRDRRRMKEDEIAIRASYLERENIELKIELAAARRQLAEMLGRKLE